MYRCLHEDHLRWRVFFFYLSPKGYTYSTHNTICLLIQRSNEISSVISKPTRPPPPLLIQRSNENSSLISKPPAPPYWYRGQMKIHCWFLSPLPPLWINRSNDNSSVISKPPATPPPPPTLLIQRSNENSSVISKPPPCNERDNLALRLHVFMVKAWCLKASRPNELS